MKMKAKTRILAMLLTVLMVVGMLPLAIFADEGSTTGTTETGAALETDWSKLKAKLEAAGYVPYAYQDFEDFAFEGTSDTVSFENKNYWGSSIGTGIMKGAYSYASKYAFGIKNIRQVFTVKKESGNNALYMGAATALTSENDTFLDYILKNQPAAAPAVAAGEDIYASIDLKMGSDLLKNVTLFSFVVRPNGGKWDSDVVGIYPDGGIYIDTNGNRSDVVGYLSKTEYTRVSVKTDITNNRFYLYINNVLVNPNGSQLISDKGLKHIQEKMGEDKAAKDTALTEIRCLNTTANVPGQSDDGKDLWGGLYIDNLLFAGKVARTASESVNTNVYTMDLSKVSEGEIWQGSQVALPGTSAIGTSLVSNGWNSSSSRSVVYYKEADGSYSIKYQKVATSNDGGQAYFGAGEKLVEKKAEYIGVNWSFSVDVKAGSNTVRSTTILDPIERSKGKNEFFKIGTNTKRQLTVNDKATDIAVFIPTDRFINIRAEMICNTVDGHVWGLVYVDGECVHRAVISSSASNWIGYEVGGIQLTENTPLVWDFHFMTVYENAHIGLAADDLHLKNLTIKMTDGSATAANENPFAVTPGDGFYTTAGITRYFEDGAFKTEEFTAKKDGEKYAVKANGEVIGKISDGVVQTPYAPYIDWQHASGVTYTKASENGSDIGRYTNGEGDYVIDSNLGEARGAQMIQNDGYVLFNRYVGYGYKNAGGAYYDYGNNLSSSDLSTKPVNTVIDLDIKAGSGTGSTVLFAIRTKDAKDGNQKDTTVLSINGEWLVDSSTKLQKLSYTEYTRVSLVVKTLDDATLVYDLYLNGVLFRNNIEVKDAAGNKPVKMTHVRFLYTDAVRSLYLKNYYIYGDTVPQQFYTMENGAPVLTSDKTKTPATPKDIKTGFVSEDSVTRYYGENGMLPLKSAGFTVGGRKYSADENGVVYSSLSNEITLDPKKLSVSFKDVVTGEYIYSPKGSVFGVDFDKEYFALGKYNSVKLELYIPDTALNKEIKIWLGEGCRYYKINMTGKYTFAYGDGSYVSELPEGYGEIAIADCTLTGTLHGGEEAVIWYDTDDVKGVSADDTFYVRTKNIQEAKATTFTNAGMNTVEFIGIDNGELDIDHLELSAADVSLSEVKLIAIKLVSSGKLVIDAEAADGISADGNYYYKKGVAVTGWITVTEGETETKYYADPDTAKLVKGICAVEGVWSDFGTDGKLVGTLTGTHYVKNGFDENGNVLYAYKHFGNGEIDTGLISTSDGEGNVIYYCTDENGVAYQNRTYEYANKFYVFDNDGKGTLACDLTEESELGGHEYGDDWEIITPATCQTKGIKAHTCKKCGNIETAEIDIDENAHVSHNNKGIADCNETCIAKNVKADGVTSVYGYSLTIGEELKINIYLDIEENADGTLQVGRRSEFIVGTVKGYKISEVTDETVDGKALKKVSVSIPAHATDFVVMVRYIKADGSYGSTYEYTADDYVKAVDAHVTDDVFTDEVKALVKAFGVYAENVNEVLHGDVAPDPITDITEKDFKDVGQVNWSENEKNISSKNITLEKTYENIRFAFEDVLKLKVSFTISGVSSDFKFYVNGEEVKPSVSGKYYTVEAEIDASKLGENVEFKVTHTNGAELTLNVSALSYAKRTLMSNDATDAEKNLAKAIYKYSTAINAYLGSLEEKESGTEGTIGTEGTSGSEGATGAESATGTEAA